MISYEILNNKRILSRFVVIVSIFLASFFIVCCNIRKVPEKKTSIARISGPLLTDTTKITNSLECKPTFTNAVVSLGKDITPVWSSANRGEQNIFPDAPVRAYRLNAKTCIHISMYESLRICGKSLSELNDSGEVVYRSPENKSFQEFDYHNWLFSPYVLSDDSMIALAHSEWYDCLKYPMNSENNCNKHGNRKKSRANAVTLYRSVDAGSTWNRIGILERPKIYPKSFESIWRLGNMTHIGFFHPSNIIREGNRYYSFVFSIERDSEGNVTKNGIIILSTDNPLSSNWEQLTPLRKLIHQPYNSNILPGTSGWSQVSVTWNSAMCRYLILFWNAHKKRLMSTTTASLANPVFTTPLVVQNQEGIQLPENAEIGLNDINYPIAQLDPDSLSNNFETTDDSFFLFMNSFNRKDVKNRSVFRVTARLIH